MALVRERLRKILNGRIQLQGLLHQAWQLQKLRHQRAFVLGLRRVFGECHDEHGKRRQLRGERLGRGNADFGTRSCQQHQVGCPHHRAFGDVAHRQGGQIARLFGVAQRRQRIGGFSRLGDGDEQGVGGDHRTAVAVFAGDLHARRNPANMFDEVSRDEPGVITRPAGGDVHGFDRLEHRARPRAEGCFEQLAARDALLEGLRDRKRLFVDFLQHEVPI